jgi:ferredoxin
LEGIFSRITGWLGTLIADQSTLLGTLAISVKGPSFYYTLAYSLCVVIFGIRRIRRRRTPYVKLQTITLMIIQVFPLFLLPELFLPWFGQNGWFDSGLLKQVADGLFPAVEYGHGREYWRAYGLILAWPLFIYNIFTSEPLWWWLAIGFAQTFLIIPGLVYFYGKGAYCGWICSCGALAETLGDTHRHKMPHGPFWNRLNMLGQVILWAAFLLLGIRIYGWYAISTIRDEAGNIDQTAYAELPLIARSFDYLIDGRTEQYLYILPDGTVVGEERVSWSEDEQGNWIAQLADESGGLALDSSGAAILLQEDYRESINYFTYKWIVDILLAGIIGVGLYFWYSGRVWCRFACPLAALMHIYAKFSRFRIFSDKKKCISCNVCTSVCHQGIDVMSFANKGVPMNDPQCVRCSACVSSCPTAVLSFGQSDAHGHVLHRDRIPASLVATRENDS